MTPLRIALVAHPRHPIAEPFKGGMEAHSFHLAKGLIARGHDVTLFAAGDSDARFTIDPVLDVHYDRDFPWENARPDPRLYPVLDRAFASACPRIFSNAFDVVHNNSLHRFVMQGAKKSGLPCVTSLHVPPFEAIHGVVRDSLSPTHRATVTSQRQTLCWWPEGTPDTAEIVHNGIDLALWPWSGKRGNHALWCGRITPNKGPHHAIRAARQCGIGLRLFGVKEDDTYFDREIAPLLDEKIIYGGVLDGAGLAEQMREAALLLFTPCWDEPFGLVAVEAMASGLPVAAFDQGATREIIGEEAGRFAPPDDPVALAAAILEALKIDRIIPRRRVEEYFSLSRMVDRYEALYEKVITCHTRTHAAA
ncbi:glycosyltransferase [Asaia siamensis]|uniref:Glycosyl transferase family 1 n=1 Tax=Asaia siamensis TaxID=110479 RepID=A0ABQ1L914_9PROT|nr:glycosyltransferase [Asaia siamensis]GBR09543.1 glycosyltransferase [Asaia siamensis NRIC 0323]GGC19774.1 glycosyl transferase family 1 [Asaia siamensis]